ncbi:MAG TPA: PASTA domain-containing protein, partial [Flavobacteriaceae bacterium]|nr:PASTA domain-containing protein [Flavobacteriaceae bacterium]
MSFIRFVFSKTFLKQLLLAIVGLVILVFLILKYLDFSTNHNQKIAVPDLSKLSLEEAEKILAGVSLRVEVLDSANFNPDFPKFSVIEQIPNPGQFVKENRKIYITLNPSGYRKVEIPKLTGQTIRQVEPTLRGMGFEIGTKTYKPHIAKDEVLELTHKGTTLEAGTELHITSVIDLVLGDGTL